VRENTKPSSPADTAAVTLSNRLDMFRSTAGRLIRLPEPNALEDPLPPSRVIVDRYPDGEARSWVVGYVSHRVDGPAHESAGLRIWKQFGQIHRENGPAWERDGESEFYLRDVKFQWALPPVLWGVSAVRNNLLDKATKYSTFTEKRKARQRSKALRLLGLHADEIDAVTLRAVITQAWTDKDPELRRWGQQLAGLLGSGRR
jgi:hypothetical protein